MKVIFIHGPAAAGKYTVGSALGERMGLPLFHNHLTVDLAKTLFDFGTESFARLRAEVWRISFREAAAAGRSFIFTFHPEATVERGLIDELISIVQIKGGRVHFVELHCSRDVLLSRLGNESRARFGKLLDREIFCSAEESGAFDFSPLPEALIAIDSEAIAPARAAELIEEALKRLPEHE